MFNINWSQLTTQHATQLTEFLNKNFKEAKLPDFVGAISVSDLVFGQKPPVIQLLDISPVNETIKENLSESIKFEDDDIQIRVKLHYNGDAQFKIHTALVLNWPTQAFATLPMTFHVLSCLFSGTAVIIRQKDGIGFTFESESLTSVLETKEVKENKKENKKLYINKNEEEGEDENYKRQNTNKIGTPTKADRRDSKSQNIPGRGVQEKSGTEIGPLKDIKIHSDIGADQDILRNAKKVEAFIITEVRRIINQHAVYPIFIFKKN